MNSFTIDDDDLFFRSNWNSFKTLEKITAFFVLITPVFFLSIPHWISNVSIISVIFIVIWLIKNRSFNNISRIKNFYFLILLFSVYLIAVVFSQLGRQTFVLKEYLDKSRWLIGIPFFIFIYLFRINYLKVLDWAVPFCILFSWLSSVYFFPSTAWGPRSTVVFLDPLTFGVMNISLASMCLASFAYDFKYNQVTLNTYFKIFSFCLGIYLSVASGSKSGWFALPIIFFLVLQLILKPTPVQKLILSIFFLSFLFILFFFVSTVNIRISAFWHDLVNYSWAGGLAPDTSTGARITFYRLGFYYFTQNPLFGWGLYGYSEIKDSLPLLAFSSQNARDFAFSSLFHSEWTTQSVHFGFFGFLAVISFFFIPIKLFANMLKLKDSHLKISCVGLSYLICQLVASFGVEVFNSKGTIAFTSIILAGLIATSYSLQNIKQSTSPNLH
jgi:O-antigen ligase